jgi:small subunit ribosomal protein S20
MAHSLSAKKRVRQTVKRKARNKWRKSTMREAVKEFLDKVAHGTPEEAATAFRAAAKVIDRTAQVGTIHKNQAARRKSRLAVRLKGREQRGVAATVKGKKSAKA